MAMYLNVYLIATQFKSGVSNKSGSAKAYEIHTADVLFNTTDPEGVVSQVVATMRLPKLAPRGLQRGDYVVEVEPYASQTKDLAFAIRKIEPAPVRAAK